MIKKLVCDGICVTASKNCGQFDKTKGECRLKGAEMLKVEEAGSGTFSKETKEW